MQANQSYVTKPIRRPARGFETTTVGLEFRVEPRHFKKGDLKLKCLATIATVYWQTSEESTDGDNPQRSPALEMKDTEKSVADRVRGETDFKLSFVNCKVFLSFPLLLLKCISHTGKMYFL